MASSSLVVVTFEIETNLGKKEELLQTLDELTPIIKREGGCRQVDVSQSKLHKDVLIMKEKWATQNDALCHFRSEPFYVLTGAASVLARSLKMTINIELQTACVDLKNMESRKEVYLWAEKALSKNETGFVAIE